MGEALCFGVGWFWVMDRFSWNSRLERLIRLKGEIAPDRVGG